MTSYEIVTVTETPDPQPESNYGDANCDGTVTLADAVLIMQYLGNPDAYGVGGTDANAMTAQGEVNSDCCDSGDGVTNKDALAIQSYLLKLVAALPTVSE